MRRILYSLTIIPLIFTLFLSEMNGQEVLTGEIWNYRLDNKKQTSLKSANDTINLPLIEDFAKTVGYPDDSLWSDEEAYINYQFPKNAPSIGVATMDAINREGLLHPNNNDSGFLADSLTSNPIKLAFSESDSIYISFYYQPGGLGDTPEPGDSLILQFYNNKKNKWNSIWQTSYNKEESELVEVYIPEQDTNTINTNQEGNSRFWPAILPVRDSIYRTKNFRFRFINYASVSGTNTVPSIVGNVDHWNIDFLRLDTGRYAQDTTINDIAFTKYLDPLLINYNAIPWNHFSVANTYEMKDIISITYKNLGDEVWNISREFSITDLWGPEGTFAFTGGTGDNIPPYTKEEYQRNLNYIFPDNDMDSAKFEVESYLVTDTASERAPYRWNDTIKYFQEFYNYYAYDDGIAENGYGLLGQGSASAQVAIKFHNYKEDTLQGLQMYFNQTKDSANQNYFKILIWENSNGKPGKIIHSEDNFLPNFQDSVNQFSNYIFYNKPIIPEGDFFVGYQKFTNQMMNVGLDLNNINNDKTYYNLDGTWRGSEIEGTLMIRPVFGKYLEPTEHEITNINPGEKSYELTLYPNPANYHINVKTNIKRGRYTIFNIVGKKIKEGILSSDNERINISGIEEGIYILQVTNSSQSARIRKKFLVTQ